MRVEEIFLLLSGQWQLERSVNDYSTMKGIAVFSAFNEGDSLFHFYREEGEHTLRNGTTFSFFREYIYSYHQPHIDVYFVHNNKRSDLLHKITLQGDSINCLGLGTHSCGDDLYTATYRFLNREQFTLQYTIHGPRKNLTIQTFFNR